MIAPWLMMRCQLYRVIAGVLAASMVVVHAAADDVFSQDLERFEKLLASELALERIQGVQGFSHYRYWTAETRLLVLLKDSDSTVRLEAVIALGRLGTAESVGPLLDQLTQGAWEIREHAHLGLCRMTAQSFASGDAEGWRAWWQGRSPEAHARELWEGVQGGALEPEVRRQHWRALRHLGTAAMEPSLLEWLGQHGTGLSADEREYACEWLERIGTARSLSWLRGQPGEGAAWALGRIGGPEAEAALLQFPKTLAVWLNLDRLHSTNTAPFLPQLIYSFGLVTFRSQPDDLHLEPQPIQRVAANLIRRNGQAPLLIESVVRLLEETAKVPSPAGPAPAVPPPLASQLQAFREELRPGFVRGDGLTTSQPLTALYHVATNGDLAPRLVPLLRHPAFVPRIYVAMLLAKLQATNALEAMVQLVNEPYPFSDATALASGKHFDQSQTVRWKGFLCLAVGRMGGEAARRILEQWAADPARPRDVRYCSVTALGYIRSPKSLPVLRQVAREDLVWMHRDAARQLIADLELRHGGGER